MELFGVCICLGNAEVSIFACVTDSDNIPFYNLGRQAVALQRIYVYEQVLARRVETARISMISSRRFEKVRRHCRMIQRVRWHSRKIKKELVHF